MLVNGGDLQIEHLVADTPGDVNGSFAGPCLRNQKLLRRFGAVQHHRAGADQQTALQLVRTNETQAKSK
jgi:hypothetical protein